MACLRLGLVGVGVCLALAPLALGETLLLRDGTKIETAGEFEVRGERVIYTDTGGALRSLSLDDVDLIASRRYRDEKSAEPQGEASEAEEPREPRLVLGQGDIPSAEEAERQRIDREAAQRRQDLASGKAARPADEAPQGGAGRSKRDARNGESDREGYAIIGGWSLEPSRQTGGVQVVGTVTNPSEKALDRVKVRVLVRDREGKLLRSGSAFVDRTRLKPGWSSPFHFVDTSFSSPKGLVIEFRVTARVLSWGARPRSADPSN